MKGYGLFDVISGLKSTLSSGVLSGIVRHNDNPKIRSISRDDHAFLDGNMLQNGTPVLLHSTCAVHKGASGGALICQNSGKLLGTFQLYFRSLLVATCKMCFDFRYCREPYS